MNKKIRKQKGITLIALVITIIILLILAGISIASLTGSGLFERAKESKEKSIEAQIKEEIEMAIMDIQIEEMSKGNNVTLEVLENILPNKLKDIEAELDGEEIDGEYKDYSYTIDKDLKVEINGPMSGEKPTITFSVNTTDIGASEVTITATATVSDGTITKIIKPDGTEVSGAETTYTVNKSGSYIFRAISSTGRKGKNTINIENIKPNTPIITQIRKKGYGVLLVSSAKLNEKSYVEIQYDECNNISNYYREDEGEWKEYHGAFETSAIKLEAKSVIKEGVESDIASINMETPLDALGINSYDGDIETYVAGHTSAGYPAMLVYLDETTYGKNLYVDYALHTVWHRSLSMTFYNSDGIALENINPPEPEKNTLVQYNTIVPEGSSYVVFNSTADVYAGIRIYELTIK